MLVFAGVAKKCLQHGHSFRLAGVWLKSENLRFACAVTRFCSSRVKKNTRSLWFSIIRIIPGRHSLIQFFPLLDASVPERLRQRRSHRLQQGSIVTPCPAVGPSVFFFGTLVVFFVEHRHRSPFSEVFPCSIYLLSTSNNGSIGSTPQTTSNMISLSKDILFVFDLGHLEPFVGKILGTKIGSRKKSNKSASESMCNMSTTATCSVT